MNSERGSGKVIILSVCKQFYQMLQIQKAVIDWGGGEHKHLFLASTSHHIKQFAVTVGGAVTKMMRLIDYDNFCLLLDLIHEVFVFLKKQISVIDNLERIETLQDFRDILFDGGFPYRHSCGGRYNQHNILPFLFNEAFNEHHTHKGLA